MAIHYLSKRGNCFLSTNYKVWFSTLENQQELVRASTDEVLQNSMQDDLSLRKKHFLLTRDPYDRLESFFRDKFRKNILSIPSAKRHNWQYCQRLFFSTMQIRDENNTEKIREAFLKYSFADFMNYLPNVWRLDGHLAPQYEAHFLASSAGLIKLVFDSYLPVESENTSLFLTAELEIDLSLARNSTKSVTEKINWTPEARAIANKIYREDFVNLNYEIET
jgi:hypothetical protein